VQTLRHAGRRLAQMVPTLLLVTLAVFVLSHMAPGNPARILLGQHAYPAAVRALSRQLGLDVPLWQQYLLFLWRALHLNLGISYSYRTAVGPIIGEHLGVTLALVVLSIALTFVLSLLLAVAAAVRVDAFADHAVRVAAMVLFAMPPFWLGIMLILLLAVDVPLFPVQGFGGSLGADLYHLVLPVLTVSAGLIVLILRPLRSKIVQILSSDFVDAARARGLTSRRIVWRHVVPNALISTVTLLALNLGYLLGGTVIVENVFGLPGLGQLLVQSVEARDYPVVEGLALFFAVAVIAVNFLADIAYTLLDPRVSLE
jgi:peptide/nickel transport system permease protein